MKAALFLLPILILISLQSIQLVKAQGLMQVPCPGNLSGTCLHLPTATPTSSSRAAPASQQASVQQQHCWTVPYPNGTCPVPTPVPGTPAPTCPDGSTPDSKGYCGPYSSSGQNNNLTSSAGQHTTASGTSQWQEFGVFLGPIQKHTGVFHNENGVFIPWTTLCGAGQSYLLQSCASLINPDGSLTSAGDTAVGCITNGAIISALAASFNLPLATIKAFLGPLAGLTGCGGIVDMNQIQNSPDVQRLLQFAGTLAR